MGKLFSFILFMLFAQCMFAANITFSKNRYYISPGGSLTFSFLYNSTGTDGNIDRFPKKELENGDFVGVGCLGDASNLGNENFEITFTFDFSSCDGGEWNPPIGDSLIVDFFFEDEPDQYYSVAIYMVEEIPGSCDLTPDSVNVNGSLSDSTYYAKQLLSSTGLISSTNRVRFVSDSIIQLGPNFEVQDSAFFEAIIGNCDTPVLNIGYKCEDAIPIFETGLYLCHGPDQGGSATSSEATHALWYKFTAPENGLIDVSSCGFGIDTQLRIHAGTCSSLSLINESDDACALSPGNFEWASALVGIPVSKDETYLIEWDNEWSNQAFNFEFAFAPN